MEGIRHSPILSALFRMTPEDSELLGAAQFIKGKIQLKIHQNTQFIKGNFIEYIKDKKQYNDRAAALVDK